MTPVQHEFFDSFYRENLHSLIGYAYRYLKDWEDAKEVTQEAFFTGFIKIDQFYNSKSQIGWIKKTIYLKALNMIRSKEKRPIESVPLEDIETHIPTYDSYDSIDSTLARCVELLTTEEFNLLKRIVLNGERYADVAARFGLTERTCRKRVERIIKKLRKKWDEEK